MEGIFRRNWMDKGRFYILLKYRRTEASETIFGYGNLCQNNKIIATLLTFKLGLSLYFQLFDEDVTLNVGQISDDTLALIYVGINCVP